MRTFVTERLPDSRVLARSTQPAPSFYANAFRIVRLPNVLRGILRLNGRGKSVNNGDLTVRNGRSIPLSSQLALKASNLRNATIAAVLQAEVNGSICEETFYPARNK